MSYVQGFSASPCPRAPLRREYRHHAAAKLADLFQRLGACLSVQENWGVVCRAGQAHVLSAGPREAGRGPRPWSSPWMIWPDRARPHDAAWGRIR